MALMSFDAQTDYRRFRAVFEQSEVPTQLYTSEGAIIACNSAWYRWTGLTPKDVDGLRAAGYCLLNDPALIKSGVVENFRAALQGRAVQTPAIFYNLADYGLHEKKMWIQSNFYPIADENGRVTEVLILHHDVSELMGAKKEVEMALEQARRIAQHAPVAIQIYDAKGFCIFVNDRFADIFGAAPPPNYCVLKDELVAATGNLPLIHKAFAGEPAALPLLWYDARSLKDLPGKDREYVKKHGKKCAIETHMIPVFEGSGRVANVIFVYKDVTGELFMKQEREQALKERDDAKTMIQSILDQTRAVVYIKDADGRYVFVNEQYCRIFNLSLEAVLGKTDRDLFPASLAEVFRRNDLHVQETKSHLEIEEAAVHSDGKLHTYLSLKFPLHDSGGAFLGVCGISTDITQHRLLEAELNAAKRMEAVGMLAGGIAHNFNNILGIILLVADTLLLKGQNQGPDWKGALEMIKGSAQSASLLTRQLLAFGRQQGGLPSVLDLGTVVTGMKEIFEAALGADIRFAMKVERGAWPVFADPLQIEQVLANLCLNARDAMPKGGTLEVSIRNVELEAGAGEWRIGRPRGSYVELSVADSGIGIQNDVAGRIFEPFFTTKKSGTGLGLATVYGIMQTLKGDIAVDSMPGKGTRFRLCFPRAAGAATGKDQSAAEDLSLLTGSETILLVEDQGPLRHVTANLLRGHGYTVIEARDAIAALDLWKIAHEKVDVVLTDVVMPGMSGVEMIQRMAQLNPRKAVKALFMSAYSDSKLSEHNARKEELHFLEKPYTAHGLFSKLRMVLGHSVR